MQTVLFIDGENFLKKLQDVLIENGHSLSEFNKYNFNGLFNKVLENFEVNRRIFYFAKIHEHKDTLQKSRELIEKRRRLKTHLENTGFEVVIKGNVRGQLIENKKGRSILSFREKGVDVKIAVDMVSFACDKKIKTSILASSDSDLQPAIEELKREILKEFILALNINQI